MRKEYVKITRNSLSDHWAEVDEARVSQTRTVIEDYELIDIGVLDKDGEPIYARKKMNPIGFVHYPDKD